VPLAYLALGSNLGDRLAQMRQALERLQADYPVTVRRSSAVYENRAIGMGPADDFLNAVVELETTLAPEALLEACLAVELKLGRERKESWAPRTIDLDLIVYEGVSCATSRLTLPHPRLAERDFVAVPLHDLAPDLRVEGRTVSELLADLATGELRATDYDLAAAICRR